MPKIDYLKDARERGLTLVGHELRLVPHKPVKFGTKVPAKTLDGVAACAALGLSFWSDHPERNTVWAADFDGNYHAVYIDKNYNRVKCLTDGRSAEWHGETPATAAALFTMLGGGFEADQAMPATPAPRVRVARMARGSTPPPAAPPVVTGQSRAVAMLAANPDLVSVLHIDYLREALGHTPFDDQINAELDRREKEAS
jgi:hypothetical protein